MEAPSRASPDIKPLPIGEMSLFFIYRQIQVDWAGGSQREWFYWEQDVQHESNFYWGQNEDYKLGNCISDISEKPFQRAGGKVSIYMILVKEEYMQLSTYFFCRRSLLITEKAMAPHSSTLA